MAGMRRLIAIAVVVGGVAWPVYAQRGGSGHSGGGFAGHSGSVAVHSSGMISRSVPAFRGSVPAMGRTSFMGAPQLRGGYSAFAPNRASLGRRPVAGYPERYGYQGRRDGDRDRDDRYRRPYPGGYGTAGYGYGYVFPSGFTIWPGSLGDLLDSGLDSGLDDYGYYNGYESGYNGYGTPYSATQPPPVGYALGPYAYGPPPQYAAPPIEQAQVEPPDTYRPAYQSPEPAPQPDSAVTLIFKDGRPNEQVHNYMLTRSTLYVQDAHRQEIPVDELDLAATQKANKDAGVDFQLPGH